MYRFVLALVMAFGLMIGAAAESHASPMGLVFPPDGSPVEYSGSWVPTNTENVNIRELTTVSCDAGIELYIYDIDGFPPNPATDPLVFASSAGLDATNIAIDADSNTLTTPDGVLNTNNLLQFGIYFLNTNTNPNEILTTYNVVEAVEGRVYRITLLDDAGVECATLNIDMRPDNVFTQPIPLPGAAWLLAAGLAGFLGLRRHG